MCETSVTCKPLSTTHTQCAVADAVGIDDAALVGLVYLTQSIAGCQAYAVPTSNNLCWPHAGMGCV